MSQPLKDEEEFTAERVCDCPTVRGQGMFGNWYAWRVEHLLQPQGLLPEELEDCLGHRASEWWRRDKQSKVELSDPKTYSLPSYPLICMRAHIHTLST